MGFTGYSTDLAKTEAPVPQKLGWFKRLINWIKKLFQ